MFDGLVEVDNYVTIHVVSNVFLEEVASRDEGERVTGLPVVCLGM
jgi:hypothetical protein